MGDKDRTKLSRIKANLPIDIGQPVLPLDVDGNPLGTVAPLKVEGTVEIDSTTPVNVTETNSAAILTELEKDNFESSILAVETWLELPKNIKAVSFILDCSDNTEATLEYTFDRAASPSHSVESELGTVVNDVEAGYLAGAAAQVRMDDVVDNEVLEVKASVTIDVGVANDSVDYTSTKTGTGGNGEVINYVAASGDNNDPLEIQLDSGDDIFIYPATDGAGEITTTMNDIIAQITAGANDAELATGSGNEHLLFSKEGFAANAIPVESVEAGNETPLSVSVDIGVTDLVTINLETDVGGTAISTAAEVKTALEVNADFQTLGVTVAFNDGDGSGVFPVFASARLRGGCDEVPITAVNSSGSDGSGLLAATTGTLIGGVDYAAATLPKLWIIGVK